MIMKLLKSLAHRNDAPTPPEEASLEQHAGVVTAGGPAAANDAEYDELDRRLMDTFPASDAVARY